MRLLLMAIFALTMLSGCSGPQSLAPVGPQAYEILEQTAAPVNEEYRIGPFDTVAIRVFQEPELSFEEIIVDPSGSIPFPLLGTINVNGLTAVEASRMIAGRLGARYIVNPQVTVLVLSSTTRRITVEGEVKKAGIFPIDRPITLLQSIALAEGVTDRAKMDEIIVFRRSGDAVFAARFDLEMVRKGLEPDPMLQAGDVVVVGYSSVKGLLRDILTAAPLLTSVFVRIF